MSRRRLRNGAAQRRRAKRKAMAKGLDAISYRLTVERTEVSAGVLLRWRIKATHL